MEFNYSQKKLLRSIKLQKAPAGERGQCFFQCTYDKKRRNLNLNPIKYYPSKRPARKNDAFKWDYCREKIESLII